MRSTTTFVLFSAMLFGALAPLSTFDAMASDIGGTTSNIGATAPDIHGTGSYPCEDETCFLISKIKDTGLLFAFMEEFPDSRYVDVAKARLKSLEATAAAPSDNTLVPVHRIKTIKISPEPVVVTTKTFPEPVGGTTNISPEPVVGTTNVSPEPAYKILKVKPVPAPPSDIH